MALPCMQWRHISYSDAVVNVLVCGILPIVVLSCTQWWRISHSDMVVKRIRYRGILVIVVCPRKKKKPIVANNGARDPGRHEVWMGVVVGFLRTMTNMFDD